MRNRTDITPQALQGRALTRLPTPHVPAGASPGCGSRDTPCDGVPSTLGGRRPRSAPLGTLLTVLGTNPSPARYTFGDREVEASLAPLALMRLLAAEPNRVLALCTKEARATSLPLLQAELDHTRTELRVVDVGAGTTQADVTRFLGAVTGAIQPDVDVELTIDVTHGFRHFAFLTYVAVLYLSALRRVTIAGAYYGLLQRAPKTSPFLDLAPLIELPRWVHAVQVLAETGSALPMANLLEETVPASEVACVHGARLREISIHHASGLPLELGAAVDNLLGQDGPAAIEGLLRRRSVPLADEVSAKLEQLLAGFRLTVPRDRGSKWKNGVALDEGELARQARLVEDLFRHGSYAAALGVLQEWTVSWAALRLGHQDGWLGYDTVRRKAAAALGALRSLARNKALASVLSEDQRRLASFWDDIDELRNRLAHHGMRSAEVDVLADPRVGRVREYWWGTLRHSPSIDLAVGETTRTVLVSPMGNRPGVLYSALLAARDAVGAWPDLCLVICSKSTEGRIDEAASCAGFTGQWKALILEDPFGGIEELGPLVRQARAELIRSGRVLVNITGGTTLMGLAAEKLFQSAQQGACPAGRFGLIDRRAPADQDAHPYEQGEIFWLEHLDD